jgi:phosphoribosylaminoimidazolecarboxamide formyltransferase / IMP cyclohydrolase
MRKIQRAVLSVSDKTGLIELAEKLHGWNVQILSTGGTANILKENGIPLIPVSEYTKSPEMLDGRVKTLHPKIHAGLLAKRDNPEHMRQLAENNCLPIDMVVVNLYPFEKTVANPESTFDQAVENIDIGGPTMLRAAAKNFQDVVVIVDPKDYTSICREMEENQGEVSYATRFSLMKKVYAHTAHYDQAITSYLQRVKIEGNILKAIG